VRRLSKNVSPEHAVGEFIGVSTLGSSAQVAYAEAADEALASGESALYYEDIYSRICGRLATRVGFVEPGAWAEIDTPADLPTAGRVAAARNAAATFAPDRRSSLSSVATT